MIDGTMTVSDHGGKSILEEAVNTMKINVRLPPLRWIPS
jgi:hypothetical protein